MKLVSFEDYLEYVSKFKEVQVEDQVIKLEPLEIGRLEPTAEELTDVSTTVWSFPKRGSWATHKGDYRGNWPPQMARALILRYTEPGEVVLDPMVGSGTTAIEAKLLGRNCIGVDIELGAVMLTLHRLYYLEKALKRPKITEEIGDLSVKDLEKSWVKVFHGDARRLELIENESIDLIATHPPYFNIIKYGSEGNISVMRKLEDYLKALEEIAMECYRVLKKGKYMAMLIGDTRIHKHYVPISHYVLDLFLSKGFILAEEVVKIQHKMKTTREIWGKMKEKDFLLIFHEKLFIFRKPEEEKEFKKFKYSRMVKECGE
ncbi:MAG: DNA methyltransferase [Archaeoglobaceae archaeon]|nr:DNA methyltransferase [Archaeoglobaceae archaeon]MDW8128527.1 DNA methyltransferase [Archaeoglobaceae archaeon]